MGQLRLEAERKHAEEAERQRLEQERLERERAECEDRQRLEREELVRQKEKRAAKEEEAAQQKLQAWLQKNKYAGINTKKSKMMMVRYPLHDAVTQKDAAAVRLLLRFGADATSKNSSGRTAHDVARSTKGCEDVAAAFSSQTRVKAGGA